jgi:hypothetical protein
MSDKSDGIVWKIKLVLSHPISPEPKHPLAIEWVGSASAHQPMPVVQKTIAMLAGKRFLVVEDEPLVARKLPRFWNRQVPK